MGGAGGKQQLRRIWSASALATPMNPVKGSRPYVDAFRSTASSVPPHRTQLPPRNQISARSNHNSLAASWCYRLTGGVWSAWLLVALLLLPALIFFFLIFLFSHSNVEGTFTYRGSHSRLGANNQAGLDSFSIIIDAGSSGSRVHVFKYRSSRDGLPILSPDTASHQIRPGLSSFSDSPQTAGASLLPLLEFANQQVPAAARAFTPLKLMATAGLRRLNKQTAEAILQSCRETLKGSNFSFESPSGAVIISGVWEGIYAWVAANYALGSLGKDPLETTGIIELGGASAQVTFVPESPPPAKYRHLLELGGLTYTLYTHSFLNFGQEAAGEGVEKLLRQAASSRSPGGTQMTLEDPCKPQGYPSSLREKSATVTAPIVLGRGNYSACRNLAGALLSSNKEACEEARCAIGGVYTPFLRGSFLATANFYYTSEFLKLPPLATLSEVEAAGKVFCSADWTQLTQQYSHVAPAELGKYCFSTSYIVALLHDALEVGMQDPRVRFTNKVGAVPVDWALGAFVVENSAARQATARPTVDRFGIDKIVAVAMLVLLGMVVTIVWRFKASRKLPLKTIYDLEKGRYFTTASSSRLQR